jgi:NAD(P)-dependent dehydrogenase (short-subunit alcohol dehydrogenase family)
MGDLFSYEGKRVVVTGGATGIGAALVDLLKELGAAHVTVLDIKQPAGPVDSFIEVNLADKDSLDAAVARIEGPVDVLFSNAGVAARSGVRTCLAVNVAASRRLTDALLPLIPAGGTVVYTASMAGNGWPMQVDIINELLAIEDWDAFLDAAEQAEAAQADVYPFSKALMQVYVMKKSHETIRRGVRVNSICPAPVDTPLIVDFRHDMGDKVIDWSVDVQGNGRMAVATDIAPPLAFMGSDASAFINGVNLLVDSGFTAAMTTGQADFSALA